MALQVNKTLSNGAVASYWRINDITWNLSSSAAVQSGDAGTTGTPSCQVRLEGFHDKDYRDSSSPLVSYTFNMHTRPNAATPLDWTGILITNTVTSGDVRPAIYDYLKTNPEIQAQHGGLLSGCVDA